ncbi:MAG: Hsp20/alpha crystallin family protein [Thermoprotei archaeon]|nr:Hsp20/alpha crystallin family protein [Thermoprotei archaeon]
MPKEPTAYDALLELKEGVEKVFREVLSKIPLDELPNENKVDPPIDIIDYGEEIGLIMDLPGFGKEHIKIKATEELLEIKAIREHDGSTRRKYIVRQRLPCTEIIKRIKLPLKIKPHGVRAVLKNGVLEVRMPKAEVMREIEVMVE